MFLKVANQAISVSVTLSCSLSSLSDVPPVIATPHHFLISIYRCNIFLVAVITSEGKKLDRFNAQMEWSSFVLELPSL